MPRKNRAQARRAKKLVTATQDDVPYTEASANTTAEDWTVVKPKNVRPPRKSVEFFALPREIRDRIYQFTLSQELSHKDSQSPAPEYVGPDQLHERELIPIDNKDLALIEPMWRFPSHGNSPTSFRCFCNECSGWPLKTPLEDSVRRKNFDLRLRFPEQWDRELLRFIQRYNYAVDLAFGDHFYINNTATPLPNRAEEAIEEIQTGLPVLPKPRRRMDFMRIGKEFCKEMQESLYENVRFKIVCDVYRTFNEREMTVLRKAKHLHIYFRIDAITYLDDAFKSAKQGAWKAQLADAIGQRTNIRSLHIEVNARSAEEWKVLLLPEQEAHEILAHNTKTDKTIAWVGYTMQHAVKSMPTPRVIKDHRITVDHEAPVHPKYVERVKEAIGAALQRGGARSKVGTVAAIEISDLEDFMDDNLANMTHVARFVRIPDEAEEPEES